MALSGKRRLMIDLTGEVEQDVERVVADGHAARRGDSVAEGLQDRPRRGLVELGDVERREAPRERVVTRDRRPVLVAGRGADHRDVAARQGRLEHSAAPTPPCVWPALSSRWISSKNRTMPGLRRLGDELLDALLELAAVLRAGHDGGQRHLDEPRALELVRDLARSDALGEPLDDRGLADAGRAEQHRVALGRAQQRLDHPLRLLLAVEHRREHALARQLGQVAADAIEQRRGRGRGFRPSGSRSAVEARGAVSRIGHGRRLPRGAPAQGSDLQRGRERSAKRPLASSGSDQWLAMSSASCILASIRLS